MRILFCGTPAHAVPSLEALAARRPGWEIPLVLTQPDRERGRGRRILPSPVKEAAERLGIPVETPERLAAPEVKERLASIAPDAIAVVAYGRIFRPWLLELPTYGCINVHFSLLPLYRGVAPVARAILAGDETTGVTTMRMDRGVDTGPIYLEERVEIRADDTCGSLTARLGLAGATLLVETVRRLEAGEIEPRQQDESRATLAPPLAKEDGRIHWALSAVEIERRVRALDPWPGAFTTFRGEPFKILRATVAKGSARIGEISVEAGRVVCGCGSDLLVLLEVQAAGKNRVDATAWAHGAHLRPAERFEAPA